MSALSKFLSSQLDHKERGIDTLFIGVFIKDKDTKAIKYLPSKDFIEAGKFKWCGDPLDTIDSRIKVP